MRIILKDTAYSIEELLIFPISMQYFEGLKATDSISKKLCQLREIGDFKAKNEEVYCFSTGESRGIKRVIALGLGDRKSIDKETVRRAFSVAVNRILSLKVKSISTIIPECDLTIEDLTCSLIEGIELSNYFFQKYISEKARLKQPITSLTIYLNKSLKTSGLKRLISETQTICKYTKFARDLVNENSDEKYSLKFFNKIKSTCTANKLKVTKLGEDALKKLKMNLVLAVNAGSSFPPAFLEIIYTGNKNSSKKIALIGKGLTFDAGGLNLKPTKAIEDMKLDMAGAAAVASTVNCAAELKLKQNIVGIIPLVENMIGPKAFKPGDVITSYSKRTVEIRNTDAEGRLVLADAISYTIKKYKPELIIDLATLTGACLVALGEYYAGAMTNSQEKLDFLVESSTETGEKIWPLPLDKDIAKRLKSEIADLQNSSANKFGGTIFGGMFLKEFVNNTPWIHLDIAGPAFFDNKHYYMGKGGTGFGVRLLADFLKNVRL